MIGYKFSLNFDKQPSLLHTFNFFEQKHSIPTSDMHPFKENIAHLPVPEQFTFPFYYTPHPLCILASQEVQNYLQSRTDWHDELQKGKMFGVLVVRHPQGEIGFLAAFSGNLAGSNHHDYFVPPVYDLLNPDGYFKEEEERISGINREIRKMETESSIKELQVRLAELKEEQQITLRSQEEAYKQEKLRRAALRQSGELSEEELEKLNRQSQFEKAELHRLKKKYQEAIAVQEANIKEIEGIIIKLKEERKTRSAALQQWIFQQFQMRNAHGEIKDLCDIFTSTPQGIPPAGSGECAAPKLLQYAYMNELQPIAMAEFWWGDSPKGEIRRHGYFYPSCKHKCEPILNFMMQGLEVEPNPLLSSNSVSEPLETVYEDEYLLVVYKPSGMLSVPGKTGQASVYSLMAERYPDATGPLVVHRLDMDTSGLLLIAKTKEIHANLQEQFEKQEVRKRYIALLSGKPEVPPTGFIRLPLCPDYDNRPLQKVDYEHGKPSVTRYELLEDHLHTRIAFYPQTGRTHQLRVHTAHPEGLNTPIIGDPLYGQPSERLYLHAERLEFRHPVTGKFMRIQKEAPF